MRFPPRNLVDHRIYTIKPRKMPEFLEVFAMTNSTAFRSETIRLEMRGAAAWVHNTRVLPLIL
ncbi:hypothetical protein H6CHR_03690 [Variovorax sp. PBL-H6]|nr:hypothetical protein H6CHR_03690 [Variovorax sp. PBL-H6]